MKYYLILLFFISLIGYLQFDYGHADSDFGFVDLQESYSLNDEFTIQFEKTTMQPCPSYSITLMKVGFPDSKMTYGVEHMCAIPGPVEPYLFSAEFEKQEFFETAGSYMVQVTLDNETIQKKIKITNYRTLPDRFSSSFSIEQKQVEYIVSYQISGGTIENMQLQCDPPTLTVDVTSTDSGILQMDIPKPMMRSMLSVLVDGQKWDDFSLDENIITVTFPKFTKTILIKSGYLLTSEKNKDGACDIIHEPPHSLILPPTKQLDNGIRYDKVHCKENLEFVLKSTNGDPKCVKPESVTKLVERGWATTNRTLDLVSPQKYLIDKNNQTFEVLYSLDGAILDNMSNDVDANSVHVMLDDSVGGNLIISIPRELIDAEIGQSGRDDVFFVLIDGREYWYGEQKTEERRILTIMFPRDAQDIEIIGTSWI